MDPIKVSMVSPKEIKKDKNSIVMGEGILDVNAIPNLDILTSHVLEILTYLEDPKNQNFIKTNEGAVKMMLNNKYADTVPLGIITLLLEREDRYDNVDRIMRMFENLNKARNGEIDLDTVQNNLRDEVMEKYEYRKYGGKEQWEKAISDEVKKKNK